MQTERVDLSVVICVLDGERVLGRQLAALAGQQATCSWEVVVVDNGSTDGTVTLVEGLAADFPVPLRVVAAHRRQSIPYARNVGAMASRGDGIAFCDADDVVAPVWVQRAHDALQAFDLVGGTNRLLTEPLDDEAPVLNPSVLRMSVMGPAVQTCNAAVRREAFFAAGGFDETLPRYGMEDTEFSYRLARRGGSIGAAPDMVVHFRETSETKALLRKLYLSGKAEYAVWQRFPDEYGDRLGIRPVARELALFAPQMATLVVKGPKPRPKAMARELVNRVARLDACLRTRGGHQVATRHLLTPADDPRG